VLHLLSERFSGRRRRSEQRRVSQPSFEVDRVNVSDAPIREHARRVAPNNVDPNASQDETVIRYETDVVDAYFTNRQARLSSEYVEQMIRVVSGRCSDVLFQSERDENIRQLSADRHCIDAKRIEIIAELKAIDDRGADCGQHVDELIVELSDRQRRWAVGIANSDRRLSQCTADPLQLEAPKTDCSGERVRLDNNMTTVNYR
jgi:hypothetical protein